METANAGKENALFSNISSTAVSKPVGFGNDNSNQMVSKLNGNINTGGNKRVGPSIILKVMTGDTISISTLSWYQGAVQPAATGVTAISTELIPLLTAGVGAENGSKLGSVPTAYSSPLLGSDIATLISDDSSTYVSTRPKAFLNWMVVGEDYVAATSSPNHVNAIQIPVCNSGDTSKQIVGLSNMVVRRNGWIYIYLSNESAMDVFFDNLVINLKHGPLVEQKDYYAFGMENPALSTQAIKYQYNKNRYDYNGKEIQSQEFTDSSGLNEDDYGARFYEPQIARWFNIDLNSENHYNITPYNYVLNNPLIYHDQYGLDTAKPTIKSLPMVTVTPKTKNEGFWASVYAFGQSTNPDDVLKKDILGKTALDLADIGYFSKSLNNVLSGLKLVRSIKANPPIPQAKELPWEKGKSPGDGWTWKGEGKPESGRGNWVNENTNQKLHPDFDHGDPKGPHWGLQQPNDEKFDIFPDGRVVPGD
jgi:RHS repeat-associated protein